MITIPSHLQFTIIACLPPFCRLNNDEMSTFLLKIDRAYKLYAKDTTEKMKTVLTLCDTDGDGENLWKNKRTIPAEELNSLHL